MCAVHQRGIPRRDQCRFVNHQVIPAVTPGKEPSHQLDLNISLQVQELALEFVNASCMGLEELLDLGTTGPTLDVLHAAIAIGGAPLSVFPKINTPNRFADHLHGGLQKHVGKGLCGTTGKPRLAQFRCHPSGPIQTVPGCTEDGNLPEIGCNVRKARRRGNVHPSDGRITQGNGVAVWIQYLPVLVYRVSGVVSFGIMNARIPKEEREKV